MREISFYPVSAQVENIVPSPKPASEYLPKWYKDAKFFENAGGPNFINGEVVNKGIKSCVPFFDAMTAGYIQETWCDIYISCKNDSVEWHCAIDPPPIKIRNSVNTKISSHLMPVEFVWQVNWIPKVSSGYSILVTQPLNRMDLPFVNCSGVIDSDEFYHFGPGNYPFYVYKNFEGIIPAGTPMYQIIPIKRDRWKSSTNPYDEKEFWSRSTKITKNFFGAYRKFFHQKKYYE